MTSLDDKRFQFSFELDPATLTEALNTAGRAVRDKSALAFQIYTVVFSIVGMFATGRLIGGYLGQAIGLSGAGSEILGIAIFVGFEAIFLWAMFRYLPRASRNTLAKPIFQGRKEWTLDAAGVRIVGQHSDSLIRWGGFDQVHATKRSVTLRAAGSYYVLPQAAIGGPQAVDELLATMHGWHGAALVTGNQS